LKAFRAAAAWFAVPLDGIREGLAQAVVHEPAPGAEAPEGRRPRLVPSRRTAVLHDPVSRADIVKRFVTCVETVVQVE
jgi:hypothetical protein